MCQKWEFEVPLNHQPSEGVPVVPGSAKRYFKTHRLQREFRSIRSLFALTHLLITTNLRVQPPLITDIRNLDGAQGAGCSSRLRFDMRLDAALRRPGRMDIHVKSILTSQYQAAGRFERFYIPEETTATRVGDVSDDGESDGDSGYATPPKVDAPEREVQRAYI